MFSPFTFDHAPIARPLSCLPAMHASLSDSAFAHTLAYAMLPRMQNINATHAPAPAEPDEQTITPPSADKTLQWITVLSAAGMDYRLSHEGGAWQLHVPASQAPQAFTEIKAFETDEQHPARLRQPSAPHTSGTIPMANWTAFWTAYVLVLCYVSLGAFDATNALHVAAAMSRTELFHGEWWRSVTALTLHSGPTHLLANVFFLFFVGQAVIHELGRGLGLALILAGGIAGNYLAAWIASPYQRSVGASTACFAALGILCVMQASHLYRRHHAWSPVWRQTWIPIAAGIALLGLTGTSPGSDIAAHLFGFCAGMALAAPIACRPKGLPHVSIAMQWSLVMIVGIITLLAWLFAYLHT